MKYRKILTITLVTFLIITSLSVISTADNQGKETKKVLNRGGFRGRLLDILSNLKDKIPFLAALIDMIIPCEPSEPVTPQTPCNIDVSFDIKIGKEYKVKEAIPIGSVLTNNEDVKIVVDEMGLRCETLNYMITLPNGRVLRYIGEIGDKPEPIYVKPKGTYSEKLDDITLEGLFWEAPTSESHLANHKSPFEETGTYSIYGIYTGHVSSPSGTSECNNNVKLESPTYEFVIVE